MLTKKKCVRKCETQTHAPRENVDEKENGSEEGRERERRDQNKIRFNHTQS